MNKLTQERLKEVLNYDPETGLFIWLKSPSHRIKSGEVAGSLHPKGYIHIGIDRKYYRAHRLARLYMTGEFPEYGMDHINHIRHDNRWKNIRDATCLCNGKNQSMQSDNASGFNGVYWQKGLDKWRARIRVNGKYLSLGVFSDKADAIAARVAANIKYGFHDNHGVAA